MMMHSQHYDHQDDGDRPERRSTRRLPCTLDNIKRGYTDCTMRITYAATLTADAELGDTDNPNDG